MIKMDFTERMKGVGLSEKQPNLKYTTAHQ